MGNSDKHEFQTQKVTFIIPLKALLGNNKDKAHITVKKHKTNKSLYLLIFPQLWCQIHYEDIQMLKVAFIEERDHDDHYSSLLLKVKMCPVSF